MSLSFGSGIPGISFSGGHSGSCPSPFDAIDGGRLAGPSGSHPLYNVRIDDLVKPCGGPIEGAITLDAPVRVGEQISGRFSVRALSDIRARGAVLRLVGLKLVEQRRSQSHTDGEGHTTSTENWVEANGTLFETMPFTEPALPAELPAGATFETAFILPAPQLGPPTAHLGEAIVAWALDARWDVAMHEDPFVAVHVPVAQHPDLIRAGVGDQGGLAMLDTYAAREGGTVSITSPLPAAPGSLLGVHAQWPSAPGGRVRIELHRRTTAPNGTEGVIAVANLPDDSLGGGVDALLAIPPGIAPSFDGAGLEITYIVRVLVDRPFRPDTSIERPVAIV
jgi:hypothetical protein